MIRSLAALAALALGLLSVGCGTSDAVILATTTSTQDSGLLDVLVPMFEKRTGYRLKVVAVGSGQALEMGRRGDADVVLAHSPEDEERFMAEGHGLDRRLVMHNDFIIVGPPSDPAHIAGLGPVEALKRIAASGSLFISRGDDSGTHKLELRLWRQAGIDPSGRDWYQQTGQGMGATLTIAAQKGGYTLTDRATYLALSRTFHLAVLVEGDPQLYNVYHVMRVNPAVHPKVNERGALAFVEFLVSPEAQEVIASFGIDRYGQPLFFADAGRDERELTGAR
ncbi:MAG TPA: substrate-binding domain-containing protein [Dehalococcoidia bacterium]|nr:substrate-binding domain-containing protein [Dehalococcoidia bacterium]